MSGDITRLPQWAQREIERLRANAAVSEERAANAIGTTPTQIEIGTTRKYDDTRPRIYVPEREIIEFTIDGGKVDVSLREGCLKIMGHSETHDGAMAVRPSSSNVVSIHFVPR